MEHVAFERDGATLQLEGRAVVESQDGGLLFMTRDAVLWAVQADEITRRTDDQAPFSYFDRDETAAAALRELPDGFRVHRTSHYIICYNTSRAYAQWCGALYERLYRGFSNYWKRRNFRLHDPEMPLVAFVFADKASYARYARTELGETGAGAIIGYYSLKTNRVNMYDLTGVDGLRSRSNSGSSTAHINRVLSRPEAASTVATIVHEATHQLAFNCGLHQRYADIPIWLSEGMAVFFETPDLSSSKGWRTIGGVNRQRLLRFRRYLRTRPADSLETLLRDTTRFHNGETALDAYAEAWALNYYLIQRHRQAFVGYLHDLAQKKPVFQDQPDVRLAEFRHAFGQDLQSLDRDFIRFMRGVN